MHKDQVSEEACENLLAGSVETGDEGRSFPCLRPFLISGIFSPDPLVECRNNRGGGLGGSSIRILHYLIDKSMAIEQKNTEHDIYICFLHPLCFRSELQEFATVSQLSFK